MAISACLWTTRTAPASAAVCPASRRAVVPIASRPATGCVGLTRQRRRPGPAGSSIAPPNALHSPLITVIFIKQGLLKGECLRRPASSILNIGGPAVLRSQAARPLPSPPGRGLLCETGMPPLLPELRSGSAQTAPTGWALCFPPRGGGLVRSPTEAKKPMFSPPQ